VKTILVNQQLGPHPQLPEVLIYYNIIEGLADKEEDQLPSTEEDLFAIDTISSLGELVGVIF
jgi:hypothetical protein